MHIKEERQPCEGSDYYVLKRNDNSIYIVCIVY